MSNLKVAALAVILLLVSTLFVAPQVTLGQSCYYIFCYSGNTCSGQGNQRSTGLTYGCSNDCIWQGNTCVCYMTTCNGIGCSSQPGYNGWYTSSCYGAFPCWCDMYA